MNKRNRYSSNFLCNGCLNCLWHRHVHACARELVCVWVYANARLLPSWRIFTYSLTCAVCATQTWMWHCHTELFVACVNKATKCIYFIVIFTTQLCDVTLQVWVHYWISHPSIQPSIYPSIVRLCIVEAALIQPNLPFTWHSPLPPSSLRWTNFSLKYLYTRNLLTLG